jgi:hypothetical protein
MKLRFVTMILAAALFVVPDASAAVSPTPAWTLQIVSFPTNFPAGANFVQGGPGYRVVATNVGGSASSGTYTISDALPGGMTPSSSDQASAFAGHASHGASLSCQSVGHTVSCTGTQPVQPGEEVAMIVPVDVEANARPALVAKASMQGGGAAPAAARSTTQITSELPAFDFLSGEAGLFGSTTDEAGGAVVTAGTHPYQETIAGFGLPMLPSEPGAGTLFAAGGGLRDLHVILPSGTVVDPGATIKCHENELEARAAGCPDASQVGEIRISLSLASGLLQRSFFSPVYNMVSPPGTAAEFGLEAIEGITIHLVGHVRNDGSFELSAESNDILAKIPIAGVQTELWGDPTAESHDALRGECSLEPGPTRLCPTERTGRAFLTLPSSCGGPLTTTASADDWNEPGKFFTRSYESTDLEGNAVGVEGCSRLQFEPTISSKATTVQGESPSGLEFDLHQDQHDQFDELATANLKNATVTLPQGMVLNPSAANGREACSAASLGVTSPIGASPIRYREEPAHCPDASKLGSVEVVTPLLDHVLKGSVYLAKPFDNPFGSLLGIYLVIEDPSSGLIAKLAGRVTGDPATGRLTTSFQESPQLPLEDIRLHLFNGPRAALTSPLICGTYPTTSTLTPWSTPEGQDASPTDSFQTTVGCYASEAAAPKTVSFTAGTASPLSGAYSPFVLRLSRPDGSQHITGIDTTLPEGLLGKLAGVGYCPEAGIAQAIARERPELGKAEQASPSCPASSEVGTVNVTAGSGISPIPVSGHAYLAGPYKGAPLSLVVIVPAVAGPFDLGTVVDRVALNVGEYDARIHAVADPLPTIREGIPLDVRSIELTLNRPLFTLNPTSCEAKAIEGTVSTQAGQVAPLTNRFQVGECGRLKFKPKIAISLKGGTKRTGHPALTATVTYPKGGDYANISRAQVALPHSEFFDQGNIAQACTKTVLTARSCTAKSVYGHVKAWTPLLDRPLEGPVYLVGGYGYKLPALVAELNGQIRVLLVGKVDTGKSGGIRNTFEAVPDAPVSKFVLSMKGGPKYGLLENSEDLCKKKQVAGVSFEAQNGKELTLPTRIANSCKGGKGKASKHKKAKK